MEEIMKHMGHVGFCTIAVIATGWFGGSQPETASASCALSRPFATILKTAPVIFVGKVVFTTDQGRHASVRVLDVWRGRGIPRSVTVWGSPNVQSGFTSVDRKYSRGTVYLFIPASGQPTPPYDDNICSGTRPYTARLAKYRPPGAHRPG